MFNFLSSYSLPFGKGQHFLSRSNRAYLKNGMVVQVAARSEYKDMDAFRRAILALKLEFHLAPTPSVRFVSLRGKTLAFTYGQPPIDYARWPLFGGPFVEAAIDSQQLILKHGAMVR